MTYSSNSQNRKHDLTTLVFAIIYIAVGALLIYWNFTGAISSTLFAVGIFILIAASLLLKFAADFSRKKKPHL
jgi:Flp pilus assembly protein TadB